jgi:hypothetical protein
VDTNDAVDVVVVLAAVERAERHAGRSETPAGVPWWEILDHLGIARRSVRGRGVRAQVEALVAAGALGAGRRHGVQVWSLTSAGRRRLRRALRAGGVPVLAESPQHRAWQQARGLAEQEIGRFREGLREALDAARVARGAGAGGVRCVVRCS